MFYQFYVIFCIFSRMPRRFTLSDYLHPDKALLPPEQPPKLVLYVYPDHQKRYVPQMLHPFEGSHSHVLPDKILFESPLYNSIIAKCNLFII